MFDYFKGTLRTKTPMRAVVEVNGIGYELTIPASTFQALPDADSPVCLLAYFHVTENNQQLIGFLTEGERALFKLLISISGVGPKMALSILSGIGAGQFREAVISGDIEMLTGISGVGRKTAERLVVELREKIVLLQGDEIVSKKGMGGRKPSLEEDSIVALIVLGYKRVEAGYAVKKVFEAAGKKQKELAVEDIVRESFKFL